MTIAVTGATGQLGRIVIAKLQAQVPASAIVALARDAAKASTLGVAVRAADYGKPNTLAPEHLETEALLQASGISHTILRNGWYTENYTGSIGGALAGGALIGSAGDARIRSATREDFAEAAVTVLTSADHDRKTYELAGDEAWTLTDLTAEISRQSGRDIPWNLFTIFSWACQPAWRLPSRHSMWAPRRARYTTMGTCCRN